MSQFLEAAQVVTEWVVAPLSVPGFRAMAPAALNASLRCDGRGRAAQYEDGRAARRGDGPEGPAASSAAAWLLAS